MFSAEITSHEFRLNIHNRWLSVVPTTVDTITKIKYMLLPSEAKFFFFLLFSDARSNLDPCSPSGIRHWIIFSVANSSKLLQKKGVSFFIKEIKLG